MKSFYHVPRWLLSCLALWLLWSATAHAVPLFTAPNQYVLQGGGLTVTYSTTGIDGKPHFTYQTATKTLSFAGDQIRTVGTEVGTLVTVTTVMTIDTGSTTFTLLVPRVNLDATLQAPIRTDGITTRHKFSIIPTLNAGQRDTYSVTPLTGTASFVHF